jgi:hypothetical protein
MEAKLLLFKAGARFSPSEIAHRKTRLHEADNYIYLLCKITKET